MKGRLVSPPPFVGEGQGGGKVQGLDFHRCATSALPK